MSLQHGIKVQASTGPSQKNIIRFKQTVSESFSDEAYELRVHRDEISITARKDGAGFFYGIQTLIQLIAVTQKSNEQVLTIPALTIKDAPRFKWRGMHLDVARHFFPKEFIMKYIDLLALYKLNTFHWHLTDDQGWRIEIKKYPKLTDVGAWRNGTMLGKYSDQKYDSLRYGGFYTQEDIQEVVAYARARYITIVPEIEMPGHAVAAISAYPYLSCTGQQIEVAKGWGVFDDVFCSKESSFEFLQQVLEEVAELFPGKYIHIGGDECPKTRWKTCTYCQTFIKQEGLKDEHELQSYFIRRIEKFLNTKGKQIIGWDEILEGGLAPNAAVMSWRGIEGGVAAAKQKHAVVMSPGKPCYFDHYQTRDVTQEPLAIGGYNPIDSVYSYEPIPAALKPEEQKYILGAQGNMWTEYMLNEKQVEYMALPRMCAMAEVVWTKKENKNYADFSSRLKKQTWLLDRMQVNYAKHFLKNK